MSGQLQVVTLALQGLLPKVRRGRLGAFVRRRALRDPAQRHPGGGQHCVPVSGTVDATEQLQAGLSQHLPGKNCFVVLFQQRRPGFRPSAEYGCSRQACPVLRKLELDEVDIDAPGGHRLPLTEGQPGFVGV